MSEQTKLTHKGRNKQHLFGFINPPVVHGSTALFSSYEALINRDAEFTYGRYGTPTTQALEDVVTSLEGAFGTVLTPSGNNAVACALQSMLSAGDELLMTDSVYQPTRHFCEVVLKRLGITTIYYDPRIGAGIADLITEKTRVIFTESPGSQTMEIQDIPAIVAAAKSHNQQAEKRCLVMMDNTWASPLYFKPLEHGVDLSIQAATKYIVGHSDVMAGTVSSNEECWDSLLTYVRATGIHLAPDDSYLALRGIRTMGVRLKQHYKSGLEVANWLQDHPKVKYILHPAHPSHPDHQLWQRDFTGASGLFSFVMKSEKEVDFSHFLDNLKMLGMGFSWGGYESLAIPFDPTGYRSATEWTEKGLAIRLHIGLEEVEDIIADLDQALGFVSN